MFRHKRQSQKINTSLALDIEHPLAVVDRLEVLGEHEGDDGHELHEDVEGRPGGVLERVAHGVAHDGRLNKIGEGEG